MPTDRLLTASLAITFAASTQAQTHVYVDDDAQPGGDGLTWQTAFNDLHDAIDLAKALGQARGEIRIAGGLYDAGAQPFEVPLATPELRPMRLLGGYAGLANPFNPNQRDTDVYSSILDADDYSTIVVLTSAVVLSPGATTRPAFTAPTSGTTLDGLSFRNSFASALYNTDSLLTVRINDCEFIGIDNYADSAAVFANLDLLVERSLFVANTSRSSFGFGGAALRIKGGVSQIQACDFFSNDSGNAPGGAVHIDDGYHEMIGCIFVNNTANRDGGALYINAKSTLIQKCEFYDNIATGSGEGGAVYLDAGEDSFPTVMDRCVFVANESDYNGGALAVTSSAGPNSEVLIHDLAFLQNNAAYDGGAIYISPYSNRVRITQSDFMDNQARHGGAVYGRANVETCLFESNSASSQGGGFNGLGVGTVTESDFFNCYARDDGGGAYAVSAISFTNFENNIAGRFGGAAYNAKRYVSVTATNNTADAGAGGYNIDMIYDSSIENNNGGGIEGRINTIENTNIVGNTDTPGLVLATQERNHNTSIISSRIEGNELGGILALPSNERFNLSIIDSAIAGNDSFGLDARSTTALTTVKATIIRSEIVGNEKNAVRFTPHATSMNNSLYIYDSLLEASAYPVVAAGGFTDIVFAGVTAIGRNFHNTLQVNSPAKILLESSIVMRNNNLRAIDIVGSEAIIVQSLVEGGLSAISVTAPGSLKLLGELIDANPGFVSPNGSDNDPSTWQDNDYRLTAGSEAIDTGAVLSVLPGREFDLGKQPRIVNDPGMPNDAYGFSDFIDLGAYEFQGTTCTPDVNNDGFVSPADFSAWVAAYNSISRRADQNFDGVVSPSDFSAWVSNYNSGCP